MRDIYKRPLRQLHNNRTKIRPGTVAGLFLCLIILLANVVHAEGVDGPKRTLIGYSSELTVRPGETIDFMVNAINGGSYKADLVRVINGDSHSRYKDQFKVVPVKASFMGSYEGNPQALNLGSYVHVDDASVLNGLKSFTVAAWIFPTFNPVEYTPPDLENPDPFHPPSLNIAESISHQTIVSRYDATSKLGWALQIDADYKLRFIADDQAVTIDHKVKDWDWVYVAASFDAKTGKVTVHLREKPWAPGDKFTARNLSVTGAVNPIHKGPLRIAAVRDGDGAAGTKLEKPGYVFNGRIQDVRIVDMALDADELDRLSLDKTAESLKDNTVADFDFAQGIVTDRVKDISPSGLKGQVVNVPERAIRGIFYTAGTVNWTLAPEQYDAIGFHADDLYDANWSVDFNYTIPADLPSGIYAARLTQGDFTEYITFFVAAPKGKPGAKLALWLSDYNYLAYNNVSIGATAAKNYPGHNFNYDDIAFYKANPEYATGGTYNKHVDGTYYQSGSRLRPDLQIKPGAMLYNFVQDTHTSAFLEHEGVAYDIITDEIVAEEGLTLLQQYSVIVSASHPEYVTVGEFDAVTEYTASGGRFIYAGGNGWFWSVAPMEAFPGAIEIRNFHEIGERVLMNGNQGGLIIETGRKPGAVFGVEMAAMIWHGSSPYNKLEDANNPRVSWMFEGTKEGNTFGNYGVDKAHGGVAGFETDKYNASNGVPRHALHLATAKDLRPTVENVKLSNMPLSISYDPATGENWGASSLVFFETPNGGAMLSTGSITWFGSTLENDFDNDVARISANIIRRFLDPAAFPRVNEIEVDDVDRAPSNPEYEHADQK